MTVAESVRVGVWEKRAAGQGWGQVAEVQTWTDLAVAPRFNTPGPWSMTLPWNAQTARITKRHLLTVDFRGERTTCVVERFGASSAEDGRPLLNVSGLDALTLLGDALGWGSPGNTLAEQRSVRYYETGPAETVLRQLIAVNLVNRLGYEITLPASQGRGAEVTVNSPFDNVLPIVTEKATLAGIGVRAGLVNTTGNTKAEFRVEFYTPADRSQRVKLSQRVGTLRSWKQEDLLPKATRAIVQAAKEQQGREVDSVNVTANSITTKGAQNKLRTGDIVSFTGGTPPSPLELGIDYHAIRVDGNTFKVAWTRAEAAQGVAIDLTSTGTGRITATEETRRYRQVTAPDAETEWGRKREVLVTAAGEDRNAALDEQGQQALKDAAEASVFEIETVEAVGMRYGEHFTLGDMVQVELVTGVDKTVRVGSVQVTGSSSDGMNLKIIPGDPDSVDPLFRQAALIRALRRQAGRSQED